MTKRSKGVLCCALILGGIPAYLPIHAAPQVQAGAALQQVDRQYLLTDAFQEYRAVSRIPDSVKRAMASESPMSVAGEDAFEKGSPKFQMADPGQPYQAGDAIQLPALPWSRLIFTAVSSDYCLVEYESGGIAHFQRAALYRLSGASAHLVWKTNLRTAYPGIAALRKDIATSKLDQVR